MLPTWSKEKVSDWLRSIGLQSHVHKFLDNDITGEVLVHSNHEMLKELGFTSVGNRITILKAIFNVKVAQGIPLEVDDYIPETAILDQIEGRDINNRKSRLPAEDYSRLESMVKDRDNIIESLDNNIKSLTAELAKLKDDLSPVWALVKEYKNFQQKTELKKKNNQSKAKSSGTLLSTPTSSSSSKSPSKTSAPLLPTALPASTSSSRAATAIKTSIPALRGPGAKSPIEYSDASPLSSGIIPLNDSAGATIKVYGDKLLNRENEAYKSLQVSNRNEPCSRILLMALKKYKIEDDHQNYALFIQYSGQERAIAADEKPILLLNQFKEVDKESIIVLKSIRVNSAQPTSANDILPNYGTTALKILSNNPITSINTTATNITSQPYGNTAGSTIINPTSSTATTNNNNPSSTNIPHENSNNNNIPTSLYMDRKEGKAPVGGVDTAMSRSGSKPYLRSNSSSANSLHEDTRGGLGGAIITKYLGRQQQQDYVACYAYEAQRDDEFDVNVGDRFIVISRDMGWCVVEKDGKQGWVPEGCLQDLDQTEVLSAALPVSAIPSLSSATATTSTAAPNSGNMLPLILAGEGSNGGDNGGGGGDQSALSGSSNSGGNRDTDDDNNSNKVMHGIALYDHNRTSPNELSIRKGDTLIILEKYQDWLLADLADQRGWVPSCYVSLKN